MINLPEECAISLFHTNRDTTRAVTARNLFASHQHDEAVATGARELLRQAASLTWAALEILTRDVFIAVLNARPDLVKALLADDGVKRFFQIKAIPFEALDAYGYDLSKRMGDFFADHKAIDSVPAMKTVLSVLIPVVSRLMWKIGNGVLPVPERD